MSTVGSSSMSSDNCSTASASNLPPGPIDRSARPPEAIPRPTPEHPSGPPREPISILGPRIVQNLPVYACIQES